VLDSGCPNKKARNSNATLWLRFYHNLIMWKFQCVIAILCVSIQVKIQRTFFETEFGVADVESALLDFKKAGQLAIVVSCSRRVIHSVLQKASQLGMVSQRWAWILWDDVTPGYEVKLTSSYPANVLKHLRGNFALFETYGEHCATRVHITKQVRCLFFLHAWLRLKGAFTLEMLLKRVQRVPSFNRI